jgi:hypothetical protein
MRQREQKAEENRCARPPQIVVDHEGDGGCARLVVHQDHSRRDCGESPVPVL